MSNTFWDCLCEMAETLHCFRPCGTRNRDPKPPPPPAPTKPAAIDSASGLQEAFNTIDSDGDGKISPRELGEFLQKLGYDESAAMREAGEMVGEMDSNGDGWVDLADFVETMRNRRAAEDDDILVESAFGVYDADGKGLISAEDLRSVLTRFGLGDYSLERCRQMIKAVDKDGDGFVNLEEFRSLLIS